MQYAGYALLAVLAVIVLMIAVAALKAVKIKAKPNTNEPAINPTEQEAADYAEKLSAMVQVPTISLRGNTDLTQFYKLYCCNRFIFPQNQTKSIFTFKYFWFFHSYTSLSTLLD